MWMAVTFARAVVDVPQSSALYATAMKGIIVAVPLAFAVVLCGAAWTILQRKTSATKWGAAASWVFILFGILGFYRRLHFLWVCLALGITGFVVFSLRDTNQSGQKNTANRASPGDGTNVIVGKLVTIVGFVGFVVGMGLWARWSHSMGLSAGNDSITSILQAVVASLLAIAAHECGHAATGIALRMKIRAVVVGPLQWRIRDGKWEFQFLPKALLSLGGSIGVVPSDPQQSHREQICMIAAGPFTSFCTGLLGLCATLTAPGHPWERAWQFLALFTTISLLAGVLNLVPFQTKTSYSDGAQIYQILSGGPWADYHRALSISSSSLVTSLRPKDYDIQAIERAAASITDGPRGLHLRLLASTYYCDCGRYLEAGRALTEAESISESTADVPVEWHYEFIFGKAFFQHDAAGARLWWERLQAKKPGRNWDYWRSRSALLWIENHKEEAGEAWRQGNVLAQQLSNAGANEFHRHTFFLLLQGMNAGCPIHADGWPTSNPATSGAPSSTRNG